MNFIISEYIVNTPLSLYIYVMYKLRFCTSCNLYKKSVQVATCTNSLYKLQLVRVDLYKLQLVQIWTIANPVGTDRPAKRQKKTSCISTGQTGPVLCTRQVACHTSYLSRQSDVIASFSLSKPSKLIAGSVGGSCVSIG